MGSIHVAGFYSPSALAGAGPGLEVALEYCETFNEKPVEVMGGLVAAACSVEMWEWASQCCPLVVGEQVWPPSHPRAVKKGGGGEVFYF